MLNVTKPLFWQWPNVLAIDAVLIALCWQWFFAAALNQTIPLSTACVLGLSIWLVYTADRLFDASKYPLDRLYSIRHRFAKTHARRLWLFWWIVLFTDVGIALVGLTKQQLLNGTVLLVVCLFYTWLSQRLSKRFFPKEFFVAIIYAGGVIVFMLPEAGILLPAIVLMLLCLINCLVISGNEQKIDAAMNVRSMAQLVPGLPVMLYMCCPLLFLMLERQWVSPFAVSFTALILVCLLKKRLSVEGFRIFMDGALLTGPLFAFLV